MMHVYVISDLHVWGPEDPLYHSLLSLIRDRVVSGDVLVLAGDIFDVFLGEKRIFSVRYAEFLAVLEAAGRRGVRIRYIEGNHDFRIRNAFIDIPNLEVHSDQLSLEIGDKKFHIAHGDLVDKSDTAYLLLRWFFRSPLMSILIRVLPGKIWNWIGESLSAYSRERKPLLPSELPADRLRRLRSGYHSYARARFQEGYDYVALGHCHDQDEMTEVIAGRNVQYINVGYPRVHKTFLSWTESDSKFVRIVLGNG